LQIHAGVRIGLAIRVLMAVGKLSS
jgi:hypothetical protein